MIRLSAQISIYPLRQPDLSSTIDDTLQICHTHGLEVHAGTMSTVVVGDDDQIFAALRDAMRNAAGRGDVVLVATLSNACPVFPPADPTSVVD